MKSASATKATLEHFADEIAAKFALPLAFNPEDQLKGPISALLERAGGELGLEVRAVTEVPVSEIGGRPDVGITVKLLLAGHIELKAPGKGANPARFKGNDRKQWQKFKDLPNLIYTDGNEWALYRTGERVGKAIRFSGDITADGRSAVNSNDAQALSGLLQDFLRWHPILPSTPRALANALAPLCRLLRTDVLEALQNPNSNLTLLAADWRKYLFPDADDSQFADAYAQTLTYALLLARLSGAGDDLSIPSAAKTIRAGHTLLADALKILGDNQARQEIEAPVALLERVIAAIDPGALAQKSKGDPWLYFYEDFLAAYDPKMRKDRGVYYTPVQVVQAQVRLVAQLLEKRFGADYSFVDPNVITLDPAAGTGTYILTALQHGLEQVASVKGPGIRANEATRAAGNLYAFEILVGPYTVAHLRLTQQVLAENGQLPSEGVHVYLPDTLESPNQPPPKFPLLYKGLAEEHEHARKVKAEVPVLVCMGNPPYDRQQIDPERQDEIKRKGGWVRYGDNEDSEGILCDFIAPLESLGLGVHAKYLYNDYVYFWRWALWKVFEGKESRGIVSFITASSYLRGPGFSGMRKVMRETFDEMWILDLEGDNLGARKSENVFAIQTPVAIAIGVRYNSPQPQIPATVHYTRFEGSQEQKLNALASVYQFEDLGWRECLSGWTDPFLPTSDKPYWNWPLLTDLFPWQENGMQFKRTWPIGETPEVLESRWEKLLNVPKTQRARLFHETRDRKASKNYASIDDASTLLPAITELNQNAVPVPSSRYAYRSFDRHWVLRDNRLCDFRRPTLLSVHSDKQIYMTSLLTKVLGDGPAAVATTLIPDLDHFCKRGGRDVIPLWRDISATDANITAGLLDVLLYTYGQPVEPEDFFAYCYAILSTPRYVQRFWDELTIPGPRIPVTKDPTLFKQTVELGRRLLWLHTYGERFVPVSEKAGRVPPGMAKCKVGTPAGPQGYPESFSYAATNQELHVGEGIFDHVRPAVWEFSVSGLQVVESWLAYRMRQGAGKKSSPLDDIRPSAWQFDDELLDLLWVLDATVDLMPCVDEALHQILDSDLFQANEFPEPSDEERKGPRQERFQPRLAKF